MSCIHVFKFVRYDKVRKKYILRCIRCGKIITTDDLFERDHQ